MPQKKKKQEQTTKEPKTQKKTTKKQEKNLQSPKENKASSKTKTKKRKKDTTAAKEKKSPATKKTAKKKTVTKKSNASTAKAKGEKSSVKTAAKSSEKKSRYPAVRYSDEDLEMFRQHIEKIRAQTLEEFLMLKDRLEDMNNEEMGTETSAYSVHMAEEGSNTQEKEKLFTQIQRLSDYLKKLDEALERIKHKTYGICRVCGILIAKERLLAVPITTLSASYKIHKKCPPDGIDRIHPPEQLEEKTL